MRPIENQQLLLEQERLGDNGTSAARQKESGERGDEMTKQDDQIAHPDIVVIGAAFEERSEGAAADQKDSDGIGDQRRINVAAAGAELNTRQEGCARRIQRTRVRDRLHWRGEEAGACSASRVKLRAAASWCGLVSQQEPGLRTLQSDAPKS
jgi:hypothetical protein